LQLIASRLATEIMQSAGIPVLREGNVIHLSETSLEVVEACSGIRSLISLLAVGTIFAYFSQHRFWKRAVLVAACFPIAVFVNSLRVSVTGILAHHYGIESAEGFFHGFSGVVLFAVAFLVMLSIGMLLRQAGKPQA
jgi:exosortase